MQSAKPPIWYYLLTDIYGHDVLRGPVYREEIIKLISDGVITENTQVRIGQDAKWKPASSSEILTPYLDKQKKQIKYNVSTEKIKHFVAPVLFSLLIIMITAISLSNRPYFHKPKAQFVTTSLKPELSIKPTVATRKGIIEETNRVRRNNGLPPLVENQLLNQIASQRLEDMFKYQYFSHVSPTGEKDSIIAQRIGYHYKRLSENIACISNYPTNSEILSGWMQSPGHRSSILDREVKEIGVAVRNGRFKYGVSTIAVQIFGLQSP